MRVSDFHFDLPEELIAQHPPAHRGDSRMLVMQCETGAFHDAHFRNLPEFLQPGDLLILNDSRVIPARLFARRATPSALPHTNSQLAQNPASIEVLLTEQISGAPSKLRLGGSEESNIWLALVKPGRKVRPGDCLEFFADDSATPLLSAAVIAAGERGERTLRFDPVPDFNAILARIGHMPLPPYIRHGQDEAEDRERYQTVYAHEPGSAAAPTAGLHFTPQVLDALCDRGVEIAYLTLHVGLGTFQPVRVDHVEDIRLHAEHYTLPAATAEALRRALHDRRRIVAVGTTTTRTLEHIAREAGADIYSNSIPLAQSSAATPGSSSHITARGEVPDSRWIERIAPHSGSTSIFIAPGHRFRIVSGLFTNFHLPSSTLLMLVSAFAQDRMATAATVAHRGAQLSAPPDNDLGRRAILAAYAHAIRHRYRFYSYGDCMLIV